MGNSEAALADAEAALEINPKLIKVCTMVRERERERERDRETEREIQRERERERERESIQSRQFLPPFFSGRAPHLKQAVFCLPFQWKSTPADEYILLKEGYT